MFTLTLLTVIFIALFAAYVWRRRSKPILTSTQIVHPLQVLVVLGSGGHTGEMLRYVAAVRKTTGSLLQHCALSYVASEGDWLSAEKASSVDDGAVERTRFITRARQVHQPLVRAVLPTLRACVDSLSVVWQRPYDLVLCNGPGVCLPVVIAAQLFNIFLMRNTKVVYVESMCRVQTLSLSARLLLILRLADRIIVQWPQLKQQYPSTVYIGRV